MMLKLATSFMLIGLGAYGGGLVTISLIHHELVSQQHWLTAKEITQMLAIAQMTPGPIAINAATFVGFRLFGILGAVVATCAVVFPSLIILIALNPIIKRFQKNTHVRRIRENIQLGVLSLILFATWSYGNAALTHWSDILIAIAVFVVLVVFEGKIHPILIIIGSGVLGMIVF